MSNEQEFPHPSAPHPPSEQHVASASKMRLTMEEARLLQECNKESFYYRSMPLAVAAITATHLAVKRGLLASHPRYGSTLKLLGAGFVGWFVGKVSYRSACEEKFLHLQNSHLADLIRKKRGYSSEVFKDSLPSNEMLSADDAPTYAVEDDFVSSSRSLNLDTDKNIKYSGLDDSDRHIGSEYESQPDDKSPKYTTTYEDLRQKNRAEYELHQAKLYRPPSLSTPPSSSKDWRSTDDRPPSRQSSYRPESSSSGMENVYGDRWDK